MVCSSRFALCLVRPASTRHRQQPLALNVVPPTIQRPRDFFCAGAALRLSGSRPVRTDLELLRNAGIRQSAAASRSPQVTATASKRRQKYELASRSVLGGSRNRTLAASPCWKIACLTAVHFSLMRPLVSTGALAQNALACQPRGAQICWVGVGQRHVLHAATK